MIRFRSLTDLSVDSCIAYPRMKFNPCMTFQYGGGPMSSQPKSPHKCVDNISVLKKTLLFFSQN